MPGFSVAALAIGLGWASGEDEAADPDSPEDPLADRGTSRAFSEAALEQGTLDHPVSRVVAAVVTTPLGGFIVRPLLGGRAAEIWAERAGYAHPRRLNVAVGVAWFAVFWLLLVAWAWSTHP